jgi:hypothetical protein
MTITIDKGCIVKEIIFRRIKRVIFEIEIL